MQPPQFEQSLSTSTCFKSLRICYFLRVLVEWDDCTLKVMVKVARMHKEHLESLIVTLRVTEEVKKAAEHVVPTKSTLNIKRAV